MLTYRSVRFTDASGAVQPWTVPTVRVSVVCRAVIFSPSVGTVLRARVKRLGSDYIALTAWDTWNITVPKNKLGDVDKSEFVIGQLVQLVVDKLNVVNDMLSMTGSLAHDNTGIVHGAPIISEPVNEPLPVPKSETKATESSIDISAEVSKESAQKKESAEAADTPRSKSKKRKHDETEQTDNNTVESPKRKKTKN